MIERKRMRIIGHENINKLINESQKKNFLLLADYLENHVNDEQFEMGDFVDFDPDGLFSEELIDERDELVDQGNMCGTAACACGWSPFVKGIDFGSVADSIGEVKFDKQKKLLTVELEVDYNEIAEEAFTNRDPDIFEFCFAGWWNHIDNTSTGAAKRIRYMLEHGVPKVDGDLDFVAHCYKDGDYGDNDHDKLIFDKFIHKLEEH